MEWMEHVLLAVVIGLPAVMVLMLVMTASRLTRLRLRRTSLAMAARESAPAPIRATLDKARPFLEGLGFQYRYTTSCQRSVTTEDDSLLFTDVYQSADGRTHAMASPSLTPEQSQPCTLIWATLLANGKTIATMNCYRHTLVSPPPGWTLHDEYLPDLETAWTHHCDRLKSAKHPIVQDGVEFFRASALGTDLLMSHCEKKGLLVRDGDHWRMPWRVALPFAWRLYLGQRKAAKVRSRSAKQAPPPGVEADIEAFQQQLAVQRASPWSGPKKFKVLVVTALLFLGVGSLWISWSFLPILLAVIGLHEAGHFLAMKLSGYRNLSVFFVPGLGGAAVGEKASASPWEKLFVYLAGPMPGIALAVAGLIGQATGTFVPPPWFQEFLIACLVINYLNLLPITPLDGGRVVETFLFSRLPVARFLFVVLGLAAFVAYGLWGGDRVILVIAVFLALGLPHHWRVMRVDRAIDRRGAEVLDERGAIERVFSALQHPKFAGWPFVTRAAAATALLPELQGRRAGVLEAAGGITIYLACLLVPPVAALVAVPQFAAIGGAVVSDFSRVRDDVDPEPAPVAAPPRDWYAEAAQVQSLPEPQRLAVLLGAANFAVGQDEEERAKGFLKAAWDVAQKRPAGDYERAGTLMAMVRGHKNEALQRQWLAQVATELDGRQDKPSLLLLADAKEQMAWGSPKPERIALMREAVGHREAAVPANPQELADARRSLALMLEAQGGAGEAEALLRRNVDTMAMPLPADRSVQALASRLQRTHAQVDLAWLLNVRGRAQEAGALMDAAAAGVPAKITASWEHPHRQVREAHLWAQLQSANAAAIRESWQRYEDSRKSMPQAGFPALTHEVDRFIVGQAVGDESMKTQARAGIAQGVKNRQGLNAQTRLCESPEGLPSWKSGQQHARLQAARAMGACART
ncbi:site-2 protease family protein [Ramlibacter sp. WS9]|uniref:site-2 protease family protein n=1 Tax=Ramlibacter sp. WS9 TaxID=1882741 RepID=UPI0011414E30|nr:site-2 protease family protein [Ramlibacter sp. WS9]ROZ64173.1 site-2 protease family protein [Ramlibacter sp. WS9]